MDINKNNSFDSNNNNQIASIKEFFNDAEIFITGGTGFLGKALIEKLLRSCPKINNIYVLLRSKRGLSCEERWKDFIKNPIFDRVKELDSNLLKKLKCIQGDMDAPNLGIDDVDRKNLANKINIVFHTAATVRFNEQLKIAAKLNTLGTQKTLDFCCSMINLKSVVHVSTAYSNSTRLHIEEEVYQTEPIDKKSFVNCITSLSEQTFNLIADKLQGSHPNTYTLTKSMAESLVANYIQKFPVCIVRPSIVTGAISEPFPGWIDNINGITGIMVEISRGMLHSIIASNPSLMDVIPVDIVVNTMIAGAWANAFNKSDKIQVYNCTSGQINGICWKEFGSLTQKYARRNPTKYVMMYPNFSFRTNYKTHKFYEIFFQFLPAYLFDIVLRVQGAKPIMMKISQKIAMAAKIGEFFALRNFVFGNKNMRMLSATVKQSDDGEDFNCDISEMNWDKYVETYSLGIRKFVLKDDLESMPAARSRLKTLFWIRKIFQIGLILVLGNFILKQIDGYINYL